MANIMKSKKNGLTNSDHSNDYLSDPEVVIKICPDPHCGAVWHYCPKNVTHCKDCNGWLIRINSETYWKKFSTFFFQYNYGTHEYHRPEQNKNQLILF